MWKKVKSWYRRSLRKVRDKSATVLESGRKGKKEEKCMVPKWGCWWE